jgi:hypothetical protein
VSNGRRSVVTALWCRLSRRPSVRRRHARHVCRSISIALNKPFFPVERNFFLGSPMRFARVDVRNHIVSFKTNHGPSKRRYGALRPHSLTLVRNFSTMSWASCPAAL